METESTPQPSPLLKQYQELKAQAGDALLLFRMGDFYELFGDDAVVASRVLDITLTSRDKNKPNPLPMAGVPHHAARAYIPRLLEAGYKVAIGEQVEDPSTAKGIVRREIVRTFTPAVQFENEGSESVFLATAVAESDGSQKGFVLACLDPSTGETLLSGVLQESALLASLGELPIRHFIQIEGRSGAIEQERLRASFSSSQVLVESLPPNTLSVERAEDLLRRQYGVGHLSAFVEGSSAALALGLLIHYALKTQGQERLEHLRVPRPLHQAQSLRFGPRTPQHLDLFPSADGTPSLFQLINGTRSSLGARQLRRWLAEPLLSSQAIAMRQQTVRELAESRSGRLDALGSALAALYDLERILGRINARLASPRDTLALGRSLALLPSILESIAPLGSPLAAEMTQNLINCRDETTDLARRTLDTQKDDAPLLSREGGIFKRGTDPELDRLLTLTEEGERFLIDLETREREATGIPSLKVRYNRVFGYYIEITRTHLKNVPAHYQRKQSMANAERFFTEELKRFEEEIVTASSRQKALEQTLFDDLLEAVRAKTAPVMETARLLGELDALVALARLTRRPGWTFPTIDDSLTLAIRGGRHPMVDEMSRGRFVPNDVELSPEEKMTLLITGPNMGGKSTVMRQVALIVILGQMGAPVPAQEARWGAFSSIYTRIGAHDAIARGQSTFMVEMTELAHILHHADERSLIVLDEIGRGTSTYDGISVAWSALEWIAKKIGGRTLFATHYHELTRLASQLPRVANAHMAVEGSRSRRPGSSAATGVAAATLRFLYELKAGPANESFGIHVGQLAGLPLPVVERAWKILEELETGALFHGTHASDWNPNQLSLFDAAPAADLPAWVREFEETDCNQLTPLQALNLLARWKQEEKAGETCA